MLLSPNGGVVSELSRYHTSARMPTMPKRRGSTDDGIEFARHTSNLHKFRGLPATNRMNTLVLYNHSIQLFPWTKLEKENLD
ncbi:hypothetical protein FisN_8Lh401 [Fistulifera solaris]|uniref:Uncharacterized protein n=1 Tax=Fistulifera solaris TaxID=1519565 RepID=A0A1Z5JHN7_FISSO|nr:hypothetical protein FisN_8Lh401 [Fistulifera solaris]|eukprot:GAX13372.1 hypothetical protein FisN_8Lh401 [Fistulifera solaris]